MARMEKVGVTLRRTIRRRGAVEKRHQRAYTSLKTGSSGLRWLCRLRITSVFNGKEEVDTRVIKVDLTG